MTLISFYVDMMIRDNFDGMMRMSRRRSKHEAGLCFILALVKGMGIRDLIGGKLQREKNLL